MENVLCKKCGDKKPAEDFYWVNGKPIKPCKSCKIKSVRAVQEEYYKEIVKNRNKEKALLNRTLRKKINEESKWAYNLVAGLRKRGRKEKGRNIEVDINVNKKFVIELAMKQGFICYYSGLKMVVGDLFKAPSLDRVDSFKGYTKDNVVLCCRSLNFAKSEHGEMEFRRFLYELKTVR